MQVGALFVLPCTISSILIPPPNQLSSRKWKEYVAKKPKTISGKQYIFKFYWCNINNVFIKFEMEITFLYEKI